MIFKSHFKASDLSLLNLLSREFWIFSEVGGSLLRKSFTEAIHQQKSVHTTPGGTSLDALMKINLL